MQPPTAPKLPAPIAGDAQAQPGAPHNGQAMPRAALGPAATHGTGPSRPRGGVPFPAVFHTEGMLCPAPCHGGMTCATTIIVGMFSMRCADMWRCWSHIRPTPEWRPPIAVHHRRERKEQWNKCRLAKEKCQIWGP